MNSSALSKLAPANRLLPYWAVLQMDVRQTTRSWVFRVWLLAAVALTVGYLLHRAAIHQQAGIIQTASALMSELLAFSILAGTTLVIILTAGTISSERGVLADSVLSRGISRYQYFLGKLHSRLVTVLGSFLLIGILALVGSVFLLEGDLSLTGSALALILVAAVLAIVVSGGVTISAFCTSTVLAIAILWMVIYGLGVGLFLLQAGPIEPGKILRLIPALLRGQFDLPSQATLIGWCLLAATVTGAVGLIGFARRDV